MIWSFLFMGVMIDLTCRAGICECFEYKQHKSTLKRMNRERSTAAKILGIYSPKYTHAPCHMRRFKVARVLNIVLCALCMLVTPRCGEALGPLSIVLCALCMFVTGIVKDWPYAEIVFGVYALIFLLPSIIQSVVLSGINSKRMNFDRSKKP